VLQTGQDFFSWTTASGLAGPTDWAYLATAAGIHHLSAVLIRSGDKALGILTVGLEDPMGDNVMWPTYLQLIAASLSSMVKDNSIPKYMVLVKVRDSSQL
jgi:hypothetical protein